MPMLARVRSWAMPKIPRRGGRAGASELADAVELLLDISPP
jgi:hypothetical protein